MDGPGQPESPSAARGSAAPKRRLALLAPALVVVPLLFVVMADACGHHLFAKPLRHRVMFVIDLLLAWAALSAALSAIIYRRRLGTFLRSRWKHCLLAALSTLGGILVVELTARCLIPGLALPLYSPLFTHDMHHINPPETAMFCGLFDGKAIVIDTNEDGLRTSYTRETFRAFANRIVLLGDSITFGWGVSVDETIGAVMERELRSALHTENLAVLNTGIVSYSPILERNLFSRLAVEYRPTLTIMVLDATDIGDDYQYGQTATEDESGRLVFDVPKRGVVAR